MEWIEIIKTILLGIVEGITEWLPISSTGHMILLDEWIQLDVSEDFMEMFLVVIQLGAILAVVALFFRKLNPFALSKTNDEKKQTWLIWVKVLIGVLPAAVIGLIFDDWLNETLYNYVTVSVMLVVYGVLFVVVEKYNQNKQSSINTMAEMSYRTAILIGLFQCLALIPGTSRSGVTILGAIFLGTSRLVAAEYSFFLSIPVMFGASALKLYKFGFDFTNQELMILLLGMGTAFIVSIVTIRFLLTYIKRNNFTIFGYYRIVLGLFVFVYFIITK